MKRGIEISWPRSLVIACCCQAFFLYEYKWSTPYFREGNLWLMYFVVPLVAAMIWRSWKVFFQAVAIPFILIIGETLYFLIGLKLG
jgi:hypothetical protein